jgi:hypothetical protein
MPTDVRTLFQALRTQLGAKLAAGRQAVPHPTAKGDAAELNWKNLLADHLPSRYSVDRGFVVDSNGACSEQIDILVYDRHYSTLIFNVDGALFVPAESVYAVFEVKPETNPSTILYAAKKAESVRRLRRTSAQIPHAGGTFQARMPFPILGGILSLESSWKANFCESLENSVTHLENGLFLDIGCVLRNGAFDLSRTEDRHTQFECAGADSALLFFFLRLLRKLQSFGTVPAIEYREYEKFI